MQALPLYQQMSGVEQLASPELWGKLSACYTVVGDHSAAATVYRSVAHGESLERSLCPWHSAERSQD